MWTSESRRVRLVAWALLAASCRRPASVETPVVDARAPSDATAVVLDGSAVETDPGCIVRPAFAPPPPTDPDAACGCALRPDDEAFRREGFARLQSSDEAGAATCFRIAIRKNARSADAWFGLGEALSARGDRTRALEAYATAMILDPTHARASRARARLLMGSPSRTP